MKAFLQSHLFECIEAMNALKEKPHVLKLMCLHQKSINEHSHFYWVFLFKHNQATLY